MNPKTLILLAVAATGTVAIAAISLNKSGNTVANATGAEARLYPDLLAKINQVSTVTVKRKDGSFTLHKAGDAWGLQDKSDYPIEMDPVRKMLIVLGEMSKLEEKTSDPARYDKLGVQDPDAEGSKSALITLKDEQGSELASLIIGKEHDSKAAMSNQRYVRKSGEAKSWLVQGTFELKEKPAEWLQKKILEVKKDRVRSVEITQPEGDLLAVDRASQEVTDFTLLEIPEGKELTYPTVANSIASGLEYVNLEDVEPAGKIDFTAQPGAVAKYKTFDGLVITVTTKDQDGKSYAKFEASYETPPPAPEKPADAPDAPKKPEVAKKSPEEVQKEVADLNARLSKWTYQILSYARTSFGKKKTELLKDKAPPPPPPGNPAAPADPTKPDKDTYVIPGDLPKEIQDQIKADQESKGHKTVIGPPRNPPVDAPKADAPATDAPKPVEPKPAEPPH